MSDITKASPTEKPWKAVITTAGDPDGEGRVLVVGSRTQPGFRGAVVCQLAPANEATLEDCANAELIVRAVNSYDAMKEALEAAERMIDNDYQVSFIETYNKITAALALARGEVKP
jgi:hypothetical protein